MEILENNSFDFDELETFFTESFNKLKGQDSDKFNKNNGQEFREWFGKAYLKDYLKYSHVILATEEKKIVGGAIVGMQNPLTWPNGRKFELFILGVLPKYRNRGIGKGLVQKVEEVSRSSGAKTIILNTHELMSETRKWYLDMGYTQIGVLKDYYANGDAVFLSKKL